MISRKIQMYQQKSDSSLWCWFKAMWKAGDLFKILNICNENLSGAEHTFKTHHKFRLLEVKRILHDFLIKKCIFMRGKKWHQNIWNSWVDKSEYPNASGNTYNRSVIVPFDTGSCNVRHSWLIFPWRRPRGERREARVERPEAGGEKQEGEVPGDSLLTLSLIYSL